MKHPGRLKGNGFKMLIVLFCFFFTFINCNNVHAVESIYAVQTGSFPDLQSAEKQFELLRKGLTEEEGRYLRIEKIGNFYAVRIGRFSERSEAKETAGSAEAIVGTAIIMKAYYKEERIKKMSGAPDVAESKPQEEKQAEPPGEGVVQEKDAGKKMLAIQSEETEEKLIESVTGEVSEEVIRSIADLVDKGSYEEAVKIIQSEIREHPHSPEINGWYGAVLLKMNDPAESLQYFQRAVEISPDVPDYHSGTAYALFYLDRYSEAADEFQKAITILPSHLDALAGLGLTYVKTGKKDEAMKIYNRLRDLDSETAERFLEIMDSVP